MGMGMEMVDGVKLEANCMGSAMKGTSASLLTIFGAAGDIACGIH